MRPLRLKWRPDSENSENSVQHKFLPALEVTERHTLGSIKSDGHKKHEYCTLSGA